MADGSRQTGGPFLLRNGVGAQRIAEDSRFGCFFLGCQVAPEVYHLHLPLQKRQCDLDEQEVCHLQAGYADFRCDRAEVTCFVGQNDLSRDDPVQV